ncbi:hypothetical protein SIO70_00835 [Chitinophaga sancti]|uniref:hypothetical protein n=1 Tax=Chitinophaga sancti TaxID=1004 RepID=UPI002A75D41D|nr:hypothetical protein [Chitinophaga sancti]WPQ63407.1 hypothetical protein SIO70_00835 [Chitinophaga sancti]
MTIDKLKKWDEEHPNTFARILFKDGSNKTGILKNIYPEDPNYPGGSIQIEDYFTLESKGESAPYRICSIETIKAV